LEASLAHVEAVIAEIKADLRDTRRDINGNFKWLLSAGVGATLLILGALATGFIYIVDRMPAA
jgi:hypothetical protein